MNRSNFYIISFSFHSVKSFFDLFYSIVVIVLRPTIQINKCSFHYLSKWYLLLCYKQCNFYKISHFYIHVNTFCQKIKSSYLEDLISAEGGIWTLAPLLTTYSLSRRAPSATWVLLQVLTSWIHDERRGWDSNPRALADKRFSRPPRYDHFDTSP